MNRFFKLKVPRTIVLLAILYPIYSFNTHPVSINYSKTQGSSSGILRLSQEQDIKLGDTGRLTHRYSFTRNANDLIGSANGTLMGSARIRKGKVVLDGTNGTYVNLPGGLITGYAAVTFECWVSVGENGNFERIFDQGSMNGSRGQHDLYLCAHHNSTNDWRLTIMDPQPNEKTIKITGNLNHRNNLHLVCVFDPSTGFMGMYADNVLVGSRNDLTSLGSVDPDYFFLGRSLFSADSYLTGDIDEFRIYNSALSASQVATNYAKGPNVKSVSLK